MDVMDKARFGDALGACSTWARCSAKRGNERYYTMNGQMRTTLCISEKMAAT